MPFPQRILGHDGPKVSAVGLGFGSFTGFYGPPGTTEERITRLDHAHAIGSRFWDLADIYGDSEDLVGEWLRRSGNRGDIFIATKCGLQRQPSGMHTFCSDPEYVKQACDRSLKRLGVDTIDLYYCHRVDGVTPIERTIEAMVELKKYALSHLRPHKLQSPDLEFQPGKKSDISVSPTCRQELYVGRTPSTPLQLSRLSTVCSHSISRLPPQRSLKPHASSALLS